MANPKKAQAGTPKTYRATADGYDGTRLIRTGEIFTTDITKGSWMEPVGADSAAEEAAAIAADPSNRADPDYENLPLASLKAIAAEKGVPHDGLSAKDLAAALRAVAIGKQ